MQAIVTKFHGPTNSRGARISATAAAGRVTVSFDYGAKDPHLVAAQALCEKFGWTEANGYPRLICGSLPDNTGNVYVFDVREY